MASIDARGTKASSSEHTTGRAAGRYPEADVASITDIDEDDVDDRHEHNSEDDEGAGPCWRPATAAAETTTRGHQASRPASHQLSPSLNGRGLSSGRSNPVASRRASSGESSGHLGGQHLGGQPEAAVGAGTAATYGGLHSAGGSGLAPFLQQHPSGSSISRRHANGLPARQPSGPLPGMSYLSELVNRYPVRQAPASGPQISLVSGQLYVSDRLRDAMTCPTTAPSSTKGPPQAQAPAAASTFPTPEMLIPSYAAADQQFPSSSNYMQQRRAEKEQRALYTGQLHHQQHHHHHHHHHNHQQQQQQAAGVRLTWGLPPAEAAAAAAGPGPGPSTLSADRIASATAGANARNDGGVSGGGGGGVMSSRQREVREGVERWLETNEGSSSGEQDAAGGGGRPPKRRDPSSDPSLVYRHYGIFRTYARQPQGLWPSHSMPTTVTMTTKTTSTSRAGGGGGHRVAFERDRTSSGAGGASLAGPSAQVAATATWAPPARQSAW